jgi:hypothetical protein
MLELIVSLASIGGSLSLIASVILLWREVRNINKLARAANAQAMVDLSGPFYLSMVQDRAMAELYARSARDFASLDEVDKHRYLSLLTWWLIFHENIFYQRRQGLLDVHAFKPWSRDLRVFVQQQRLSQHWGELRNLFQDEFAEYVTWLIADVERPRPARPVGPEPVRS